MIEISRVIIFFAIFENNNALIYLFIIIDITLIFINFEIVNASFLTFIISLINLLKSNDSFKFFKNFVTFDSNLELLNFKTSFFEDIYKEIFVIIDIKCLFKYYSLI